eukprot:CAMPEP_0181294232 /NCGR_PEP_ID=MMETSP1101-20121128/3486_1 /TAXON_ID=46948 /ORGANISM="Rhodomonas abbreviata, Strain Caron Lab Isolate" /LENGTH=184 /DNA_ID=CAMNT_0023398867 /DNA_START=109 /DNA_END=663 /DNA_ORIENTATION=+
MPYQQLRPARDCPPDPPIVSIPLAPPLPELRNHFCPSSLYRPVRHHLQHIASGCLVPATSTLLPHLPSCPPMSPPAHLLSLQLLALCGSAHSVWNGQLPSCPTWAVLDGSPLSSSGIPSHPPVIGSRTPWGGGEASSPVCSGALATGEARPTGRPGCEVLAGAERRALIAGMRPGRHPITPPLA